MQIVLPWDGGIAQYQSKFENVQLEVPSCCPDCGCTKFHKWGTYERGVVEERKDHRISIQRIRCVKCGKTYSYLPSFCVSRLCCSVDYMMAILQALIQKLRISFDERQRWAYALLRRFRDSENLWLVFLRSKGFGEFPPDKTERTAKIFTALLKLHREENILPGFFWETGRHFMAAK